MTVQDTQFLVVGGDQAETRRIAYLNTPGTGTKDPGLVWFPGFNSVMTSTKATALAEWARNKGLSMLRFDYSGHGQSDGRFTDGTIGRWLEEGLAVLGCLAAGPQYLVGSSMGSWIVLLILRAIARSQTLARDLCPIKGAVLLAPAWDMTEVLMWEKFSDDARTALETQGFYERPSAYDDGPYTISRALIEEGRKHLIGDTRFDPGCPVRIIHGVKDPDVPWKHANKLIYLLTGDDVMLTLIRDGDHRLSRPQDIDKMFQIIADLSNENRAPKVRLSTR